MALLLALFLVALAVVTVWISMSGRYWLPELISEHGAAMDQQLIITLIVAGVAFFLAQILLAYFIWKFRAKGNKRAIYWHESSKLEATWTIATAVIFIGLAIMGNRVWANYVLADVPEDAVTVEVTAQQFAWNIRYAGPDGEFGETKPELIDDALGNSLGLDPADEKGADDIMTQNLMAVPVGQPVRVVLRSKDVTHSFHVPQLRVKQDTVPGMAIPIHFTATKTGEYEIACTELCGLQHYMMRGMLMVMEESDYENWLAERAAF